MVRIAADLMGDREHNGFHQLLYLLIEASNVTVVLCGLLINLHGFHPGVILCRQGVQDQVRILQYLKTSEPGPYICATEVALCPIPDSVKRSGTESTSISRAYLNGDTALGPPEESLLYSSFRKILTMRRAVR